MSRRLSLGALVFFVGLAGCGGGSDPISPPPPPPAPPAVTTVDVALGTGNLLIADTTVATATVKDQFGAVMTGKTVTWSSSAAAATVTGAGAVTGAAEGTTNIVATVDGKSGSAPVTVARDDRFGYLWANSQSAASYQVANGYEHLSNGSKATITRASAGVYTVTFPGLGATGAQRTNVQVSAYNTGSSYCGSNGWQTTGADLVVEVRCWDQTGAPADARYTLLATGATALEGRVLFGYSNDPSPAAEYTPQQARSSRGGPVRVTRTTVGRYTVFATGNKREATDGPEQVLVTAVGTAGERCWVTGWTFANFNAVVQCSNPAGQPVDAKFSVLVLEKGRPNAKLAFAWLDSPSVAIGVPYAPSNTYRFNSAGGSNEITRTATGSYQVSFPNLDRTPGSAETILVTAYGGGNRHCRIGSWGGAIDVSIFCYDSAGNLADSSFDVVIVQ